MSDDDKIAKSRLAHFTEMDRLEDSGKIILQANEALVVHELRRVLERQAERDHVILEMRGLIDNLVAGHVMVVEEINAIKRAHAILLRQQVELHERQDIISAVCDVFAGKLEEEANERLRLAAEVADKD